MLEYFVQEWGFDVNYASHALNLLEHNVDSAHLSEQIFSLAKFAKSNPNCNFSAVRSELILFLTEVAESDGQLDEREEVAAASASKPLPPPTSQQSAVAAAAAGEAPAQVVRRASSARATDVTSTRRSRTAASTRSMPLH